MMRIVYAELLSYLFTYLVLIYLESTSRRGAETEGERENPEQAPHWQCGTRLGLKLINCELMTWAEIKSQALNHLSHPGAPSLSELWLSTRLCSKPCMFNSSFNLHISL